MRHFKHHYKLSMQLKRYFSISSILIIDPLYVNCLKYLTSGLMVEY